MWGRAWFRKVGVAYFLSVSKWDCWQLYRTNTKLVVDKLIESLYVSSGSSHRDIEKKGIAAIQCKPG